MNELNEQNRLREPDRHQQKIEMLYQKIVANKNAADTIRITYQTMLNILEKVMIQFDLFEFNFYFCFMLFECRIRFILLQL